MALGALTSTHMRTCWASSIGGCDAKLSREHVISESLWLGPSVRVAGFPWLKGQIKEVGLGSLTSKVLCRTHNSGLSDLDQAAKDGFDAFRRSMALLNKRSAERQRKWKRVRFQVDAPRLERWFLKTAINLAFYHPTDLVWHLDGSPLNRPGARLVQYAFGLEALVSPMGLYAAATEGEDVFSDDSVGSAPLMVAGADRVVGFMYEYRGARFVLWLAEEPPPVNLRLPAPHSVAWRDSRLLYRLPYFRWNIGGRLSHYLDFMWPDRRVPHWAIGT